MGVVTRSTISTGGKMDWQLAARQPHIGYGTTFGVGHIGVTQTQLHATEAGFPLQRYELALLIQPGFVTRSQCRSIRSLTGSFFPRPNNFHRYTRILARNGYYLGLVLLMIVPLLKYLVQGFFFLFLVVDVMMIVASPGGRRLADYLAGTQVVPMSESV